MKRLVIIDGKSVFYRGYYAMGALSTSDGVPTGGIYGFAAIATELVKRLAPTKVVVAWDSKTSVSKRRAIYSEYKAGRAKPGDDFYAQIPYLEELISALGWDFVECDDYEADDIIGTLALQADQTGDWDTYIISSDLDMLQVVDENTRMYRILKGFSQLEELDVAALEAKYGIKKAQFLDLKALKGDASDNIPGVAGIGEKTAVKLLNEFGSLEGVYEHLGEISGSVQKKLAAGKESAFMSYDLGKIMTDAPVSLGDLSDLKTDPVELRQALEKLEFKSLIRRMGLDKVNLEDTGSRSVKKVPVSSSEAVLKDLILDWDVKALMHKDATVRHLVASGGPFWDLGQADFLLNPLKRRSEPDAQVMMDLDTPEEKQAKKEAEYLEQKAEFAKNPCLLRVLTEFDLPLIPILYQMEERGMRIDRKYFAELRTSFEKEVSGLEAKIWQLAGKEFNINSPMQLSEVLFETLALSTKGIKKTARGYSTGVKELDKLSAAHPIIELIKKYREWQKLLSTYIVPLPALADSNDRVHTTFNQNVTATGRLSSTNPNLQNIPVRTETGKHIREGFVAPTGKVLVSADYSQFELRLAAILAGDQGLIETFNRGVDVHKQTAAEAFKIPFDQVTKEQRRAAKVINFGVLYGMSAQGLAQAAKMSLAEAKQFIDGYFEARKAMRTYLDSILQQAREQGYVETYFGRRRPTPDVKSPNFLVRNGAERAAQNMPIQGTEADLMKRAMIKVSEKLKGLSEAWLVCQVHDSLIVECLAEDADKVSEILQTEMEAVAPELAIKLAVDVSVGENWGDL